jgi:hypothetical protein
MGRLTASIMFKQPWTANTGWSSNQVLWQTNKLHHSQLTCYKMVHRAGTWETFLGMVWTTENGMTFGTRNVSNLCRSDSLKARERNLRHAHSE